MISCNFDDLEDLGWEGMIISQLISGSDRGLSETTKKSEALNEGQINVDVAASQDLETNLALLI